jgi:transposase, IS30 family
MKTRMGCCGSTFKGTDLSVHSAEDLDWVAQELKDRPRKRLAFKKPIELIGDLLLR